jgi:hypothetical protein
MTGSVVECYAGYRYPERPRAFFWGPPTEQNPRGKLLKVEEVERSWHTPAGPAFRVRVTDGRIFTLTYDETADAWDVRPA